MPALKPTVKRIRHARIHNAERNAIRQNSSYWRGDIAYDMYYNQKTS